MLYEQKLKLRKALEEVAEIQHELGVYLRIGELPEYEYLGEYIDFYMIGDRHVASLAKRNREIDRDKEYLAGHLKEAKENKELPYRFWENIVMKDSEMREIVENLPEKSEDDLWLPIFYDC